MIVIECGMIVWFSSNYWLLVLSLIIDQFAFTPITQTTTQLVSSLFKKESVGNLRTLLDGGLSLCALLIALRLECYRYKSGQVCLMQSLIHWILLKNEDRDKRESVWCVLPKIDLPTKNELLWILWDSSCLYIAIKHCCANIGCCFDHNTDWFGLNYLRARIWFKNPNHICF